MTKDLRDEFAPGHGELVGIIALGYNAAEEAPKAPKRKADKFCADLTITFVTEIFILNWQIYCNYGASMAILPRRGVDF